METRKKQNRIVGIKGDRLKTSCSAKQSGQHRPHREGDIEQRVKEERELVPQIFRGRMFQKEQTTSTKSLSLPGTLEEASMARDLRYCF